MAPTPKTTHDPAPVKATEASSTDESYEEAVEKGYIGERTDEADEDAYTLDAVTKGQ